MGLHYLAAWLGGRGAVALHGLMEDAATAEISRSQVWHWVREQVTLSDGTTVTAEKVQQLLDQELAAATAAGGDADRFAAAADLLGEAMLAERMPSFLTTRAYARHLVTLAAPVADPVDDALDLTGCAA